MTTKDLVLNAMREAASGKKVRMPGDTCLWEEVSVLKAKEVLTDMKPDIFLTGINELVLLGLVKDIAPGWMVVRAED